MHATSELREWFLEWLDGDNGRFDDEAIAGPVRVPPRQKVDPRTHPRW
jgi:hypothetical protein